MNPVISRPDRRILCATLAYSLFGEACTAPPTPPPRAPVASPQREYNLDVVSEQTWMIRETLQTLRGLTDFGERRRPRRGQEAEIEVAPMAAAGGTGVSVRATVEGEPPFEMRFSTSILDPAIYAERAQAWTGAGARARTDDNELDAAALLLDPSIQNIQRMARDASAALTRAPYSARGHEAAAAVLGVMGLRESAAGHTDVRRILTRLTAHLAMARFVDSAPPRTQTGVLALFAHSYLSGRNAEALARSKEFDSGSYTGRTWSKVARLLSTEDWRDVRVMSLRTFMERFAYLRAFERRVGTDRIHRMLADLPEEWQARPDWGRMLLRGAVSVQTCNAFGGTAPMAEVAEATEAIRLFLGRNLDLANGSDWSVMVDLLSRDASGYEVRNAVDGPSLDVLPWGVVASSYQRHIGAGLSYEIYCLQRMFGYKGRRVADALRLQEQLFGALPLFAIDAQRWAETPRDHQRLSRAAADLVRRRPDLIAPAVWMRLLEPPAFSKEPEGVRDPFTWFRPGEPFGLNLTNDPRMTGVFRSRIASAEEYEPLLALDPFDASLRFRYVWRFLGKEPDPAKQIAALGISLPWTPWAMTTIRDNPKLPAAERMKWAEDLCESEADHCGVLGSMQRDAGLDDRAESSYRRFWEEASDRVSASNNMEWLVERLRTTNRVKEAFEVAEGAAAVYSGKGLLTLARLQEKTARYLEARETWAKYADRYSEPNALHNFLFRQVQAGRKEFKDEADRIEREIFPAGRTRYVRTDAAPRLGLLVSEPSAEAAAQGFEAGDLIVAIEGFVVATPPQWRVLLTEAPWDVVSVALFRKDAYLDVSPRFTTRRIDATLIPYPVRPSP